MFKHFTYESLFVKDSFGIGHSSTPDGCKTNRPNHIKCILRDIGLNYEVHQAQPRHVAHIFWIGGEGAEINPFPITEGGCYDFPGFPQNPCLMAFKIHKLKWRMLVLFLPFSELSCRDGLLQSTVFSRSRRSSKRDTEIGLDVFTLPIIISTTSWKISSRTRKGPSNCRNGFFWWHLLPNVAGCPSSRIWSNFLEGNEE